MQLLRISADPHSSKENIVVIQQEFQLRKTFTGLEDKRITHND